MRGTVSYAGQHLLEIELAEKLQKMIPSAELMRFCLDGSGCTPVLRVAREKQGKQKFYVLKVIIMAGWIMWRRFINTHIRCIGAEGHLKPACMECGVAGAVVENNFILLPWNDLALLEKQ